MDHDREHLAMIGTDLPNLVSSQLKSCVTFFLCEISVVLYYLYTIIVVINI